MTTARPRPAPRSGVPTEQQDQAAQPATRPAAPRPARVDPSPATGAQSLVRSLEAVGCDVVFGIPGGAILPAYDPLYDSTLVRHILVRHEQGRATPPPDTRRPPAASASASRLRARGRRTS